MFNKFYLAAHPRQQIVLIDWLSDSMPRLFNIGALQLIMSLVCAGQVLSLNSACGIQCAACDTGAHVCRSYRLLITAVKDPASANSVQLAKLDLFTQLDPPTWPHPSLLRSVCQLQKAAKMAAEAGSGSAVLESVGTLLRVLCNIVQHPAESKHRSLRVENTKIKAMLAGHSEVANVLRAIGMAAT